jgi:hypothetical protein
VVTQVRSCVGPEVFLMALPADLVDQRRLLSAAQRAMTVLPWATESTRYVSALSSPISVRTALVTDGTGCDVDQGGCP